MAEINFDKMDELIEEVGSTIITNGQERHLKTAFALNLEELTQADKLYAIAAPLLRRVAQKKVKDAHKESETYIGALRKFAKIVTDIPSVEVDGLKWWALTAIMGAFYGQVQQKAEEAGVDVSAGKASSST